MQIGKLEPRNPLGETPLVENSFDKPIVLEVRCNHSIHKGSLFFHNKLDRKESSIIVDSIKAVLKIDGKKVSSKDIPFEIVPGYDGIITLPQNREAKRRMLGILSEYGVEFEDDSLIKHSPKGFHKVPNDTLRYIVDKVEDKWVVELIDPWHLFATSNYDKKYKEYLNKARFDIKDLKP